MFGQNFFIIIAEMFPLLETKSKCTEKLSTLTPLSRVVSERLIVPQLVQKFPAFYITQRSLPHLQAHTTCSYPEPHQSIPCLHIPLIENLTFIGPCIAIYFCSKTNQVHNMSHLFYFGTTLYMFQTVFLSIIRSLRTVHTASGICHTGFVAAC
jgi:hypothetical protein